MCCEWCLIKKGCHSHCPHALPRRVHRQRAIQASRSITMRRPRAPQLRTLPIRDRVALPHQRHHQTSTTTTTNTTTTRRRRMPVPTAHRAWPQSCCVETAGVLPTPQAAPLCQLHGVKLGRKGSACRQRLAQHDHPRSVPAHASASASARAVAETAADLAQQYQQAATEAHHRHGSELQHGRAGHRHIAPVPLQRLA